VANKGLVECFLGLSFSRIKAQGKQFTDDMAQEALKTPGGRATYAQATSKLYREGWKGVEDRFADVIAMATGSRPEEWLTFVGRPNQVFGDDVMEPLFKRLEDFQETGGNFAQYQNEINPFLDQFSAKHRPGLTPAKQALLDDLIQAEKKGASLFPDEYRRSEPRTPVGKLVSNVTHRLVSNSPLITFWNTLEIMPKAYAIAAEQVGGDQAFKVMSKTMADFQKATKGKWHLPADGVPSGIYQPIEGGKFGAWLKGKVGVGNLLDLTENPLRTFAYLMGENIKPGYGPKAVEQVAFSYRPGNIPAMLRSTSGAEQVALMRFSIGSMQLYGRLFYNGVVKGNTNALTALVGFHAITALQTGVTSTIPKPVWLALPDETKEDIRQLSKDVPHLINIPAEDLQPFGGAAIGVGGAITSTLSEGGIKKTLSAPAKMMDDPLVGGLQLLEGIGSLAQLGDRRLPVDFNTPRFLRAIRTAAENNELSPEGIGENLAETYRFKE
jgi:hypothetical protein